MTATLLPLAEQTFIDANGVPLAGGSVAFYVPNSSTPKNTWKNSTQTVLNTNPVILDSAGRAIIYGTGAYRQVVKDSLGNTIWDQLTTDLTSVLQSSVAIWCGISTGTANAQILTPTSPITSYVTGQGFTFEAGFTNTGALQVNISGVGLVNVTQSGAALSENVVQANSINLIVFDGTELQLLATSYLTNISPTGTISQFGSTNPPTGFLECNGAAISRTTFSGLFSVIGTVFGTGDGTTTFNLPDMRGQFARGWDDGAGIDPARAFGTGQGDAIKTHTVVSVVTDPGHLHSTGLSFNTTNGTGGSNNVGQSSGLNTGSSTTGITVASTYTGAAETRPINVALLYIIKT